MYTATMDYLFKPEDFDLACEIWRTGVLALAKTQNGFVRMQFLVNPPRAMAIGTWEDKSHAEAFMVTGVFKRLMEKLGPCCQEDPRGRTWQTLYSEQKGG